MARVLASLGLAVFACGSPGPSSGPRYVDPTTYASPNGEHELRVDPSRHFGAGPARYRASVGTAVVWEGELPWTLFDAEVDDDGWTIGCAYTLGDTSFPERGSFGDVHLVVLAPDGSVMVDLVEPRIALKYVDSGPEPSVERFVLAREFDRAVFVLCGHADRDVGRRWCSARISDGARWPDVDLQAALRTEVRVQHPLGLRRLPGTPWLLAQYHTGRPYGGSLTVLVDLDGHELWSRFDSAEFSTAKGPVALPWLDRRQGSLSITEPGRFSLVSFVRRERETFAVALRPTLASGPTVESVACEEFDTEAFVLRAAQRPSDVELPVAPFDLELVDVQALELLGRRQTELVGSDGHQRLFFAERRGIEVLELALDGQFVRAWRAAADTRRLDWASVEFVSVTADGGLLVQTHWDERQPAWSFAADGGFAGERATCGIECPRADGAKWVTGHYDVRLEAADGTERVRRSRSASGRWLGNQFFGARSLGPDGSLAVQGRELALFGADGEPRAAGACLGFPGATIANRGDRVFGFRDGRVLVFDAATGSTFQWDVRRDVPPGARLAPVWIEARGELWLVDAPGGYALRYRPNG
ncbi:MAG: hypothetical protein L6Q99_10905 [Planctomycetes bacterium]|nr:hypothetical protein [Planctomycetota bacterium]